MSLLAYLDYAPVVRLGLGPVSVSPHGIATVVGFLAGARLLLGATRRLAMPDDLVYRALTRGAVGALIGARFAYVANHLGDFDSPLEWFAVWNGGISLLGGIAGGLALGLPVVVRDGHPLWPTLDAVAPGLALGIAVGRVGDLVVADHLGKPTGSPLGYLCTGADTASPCNAPVGHAVHQPALYDLAAATLILAVLLLGRRRRTPHPGTIALLFGALYGIARFTEDFFRIDETHGTGLTGSQWTALIVAVLSSSTLVRRRRRRHDAEPTPGETVTSEAAR